MHSEIFDLLLAAAKDKESDGYAKSCAFIAHFLNQYNGNRMVTSTCLSWRDSACHLRQIAHATTAPVVKHVIMPAVPLLYDLNNDNVLERLQQLLKH